MTKEIKYQKGADKLYEYWLKEKTVIENYDTVRKLIRSQLNYFTYMPSKSDINILAGILYRKIKAHGVQTN